MGRQVRRVLADWQHPRNAAGRYIPMREAGDVLARATDERMPAWPDAERTYWQMYETTTAGTPLSPPCASAETLAAWLADHHASAGPGFTGTAAQWLAMIEGGGSATAFHIERGLPVCALPPAAPTRGYGRFFRWLRRDS